MARHAITFDVEDWSQLLHRLLGHEVPVSREVVGQTDAILGLLAENGTQATFFFVGAVARRWPELVRRVAAEGHEIASHSNGHTRITRLTESEFREDARMSREVLEDLAGLPVRGYRAPEFSIGPGTPWAFEALIRAGFEYDSSVYPVHGARYGTPSAPRSPYDIPTAGGVLREYPIASIQVGPRRLPVGGGSYFRVLPRALLRSAMDRLEREGTPGVLYFHPYEFASGLLRLHPTTWNDLRPQHLKYFALHNFRTRAVVAGVRELLTSRSLGPIRDLQPN